MAIISFLFRLLPLRRLSLYVTSKRAALAGAAVMALVSMNLRAGDLNTEINSMFSHLNGTANYTAPGAFRGQAMNTFSGGSLVARVPVKSYQLAAWDLPHARGSCNGIDAYGGSFSLIKASELKNMLANITAALPGLAFQLAVEAVSPLFGNLTKYFKQLESMHSISSRSSCELATSLVSTAADAAGFSTHNACKGVALALSLASDDNDAEQQCKTNAQSILDQGRASTDPAVSSKVPFEGNLVWEALKQLGTSVDDSERETIMSIVGTILYRPNNVDGERIMPTITGMRDLLYGSEDVAGAPGSVSVLMLKCSEPVACMTISAQTVTIQSFSTKVKALMNSIADKMVLRTPFPQPSQEVNFVNNVSEPVWRMLSIATASREPSVAQSLIERYSVSVAAEYAATMMRKNIALGLAAMGKRGKLNDSQRAAAGDLQQIALNSARALDMEYQAITQKLGTVTTLTSELQQLERDLNANTSNQVQALLGRGSAILK